MKDWLEAFVICLFKLLIIFNFEWKTKILKRERETSEEIIINNRGKTDGSTNSDELINIKGAIWMTIDIYYSNIYSNLILR